MEKILFVSSEFPPGPGGIGRHAADLCLALADKGFAIDVYTSIDYADQKTIENFRHNLPNLIKLNQFRRIGFITYPIRIIRIIWAIRSNKYNRLIFSGKFSLWTGGVVKVLTGKCKKIEFFVHGSEVNPKGRINRSLTHWAIGKADIIWAVSAFTKSILPNRIKLWEKVHILPNGIHSTMWPSTCSVKPYADWKGSPKLLTVGSISPRKGQHRVVNALPDLIKRYPEVHYHIVGMNSNCHFLQNRIEKLNLNSYVTIHGRLPGLVELARTYKTSDVFIMLSENQKDGDVEGFGISILEANLYDLPAIGAKGCGIEDAIMPGINGELVDGNNSLEICTVVSKILNQKDKYRLGIKDWVSQHDWSILVNEFIGVK